MQRLLLVVLVSFMLTVIAAGQDVMGITFEEAAINYFGSANPGDFVILCSLRMIMLEFLTGVPIELGPSAPSSFDPPTPGLLNPEVAVDSQSLSQVKALICSPLW